MILRMRARRGVGFTLLEILVVIGVISILLGFLLPAIERARHRAYIADCANNLRQIGTYLLVYSNENRGGYPRTAYVAGAPVTRGTGMAARDPFQVGGPQPNDVTAAVYLLLRTQHVPPAVLNCPYDDVHEFEPEPADPQTHSNFSDFHKDLGYSIANPYPSAAAVAAGYKWTNHLSAEFALAADINPGNLAPYDDVFSATPTSPWNVMKKANSENHERDGQNVLFGDDHVTWCKTPFVGIRNDNIYTTKNGQLEASPLDKDDSILLPTDD